MSYLRTVRAALVAAVATTGVLASFSSAPAANAAAAQPTTFTANGIGGQTWTVPDGVTVVTITATGGSGTDGSTGSSGGHGGAGGKGAMVVETIDVTPGDTLQIDPGGNGDHPSWGDQGYAAGSVVYYANTGGHGGNATVVRRNGAIVAIAGGGGGGGAGSRLAGLGWNGGPGGNGGGFWGTAGDGYIAGESGHGPILGYDTGVGDQGGAETAYSPAGGGGSGGGGYNPIMAQGGGHGGFGGNFPGGGGGGGAGGSSFAATGSATFGVAGVYGDGLVSLQVRPRQSLTPSAASSAQNHPVTMTDTLTPFNGGGPTPAGTVTWYLIDLVNGGRTNETTVPVVNGTSSWTLPVGLPLGTVYVGATYNGDSNYLSSSYYGYALPIVGDWYGWTVVADFGTDFGTMALGMGSAKTFHATNTGTFPNVPVITTSNPDFTVDVNGCAQPIGPGESCMFGVTFRSATVETATASLLVAASGVQGPPTALSLRGQAVRAAISVGAHDVAFANVPVGKTVTRSLTMVNLGAVPLHVRATSASSKFTASDPCDIPVSGGCTFSITYTPTNVGTDDTTLTIDTDFPGVGASVPVRANSVPSLPSVSVTPSPLAFGTTTLGVPVSRTVTVTNTSLDPVTVTGASVSSPSLSVDSSTCRAAMAPDATCTYRVTFMPRYAGTSAGQLYVSLSNGEMVTTNVSGTGAARLPRISRISPTFGPAAGGTLVTITGTDVLPASAVLFGSVSVPTRCTASSCTAYAPAGTKGTVHVRVLTPSGTSATTTGDQFTYR